MGRYNLPRLFIYNILTLKRSIEENVVDDCKCLLRWPFSTNNYHCWTTSTGRVKKHLAVELLMFKKKHKSRCLMIVIAWLAIFHQVIKTSVGLPSLLALHVLASSLGFWRVIQVDPKKNEAPIRSWQKLEFGWWHHFCLFPFVTLKFSSWWLNQPPIWKICASEIGSFPQGSGWKFQKYFSCHHLGSF